MTNFILKEITNKNIEKELQHIGFDEIYRLKASNKFKYKNIKIYNLTSAQANIIKQTALSVGADCATHRDVITGQIENSNAILGGSLSQLNKISEKLKLQPFKLKDLGTEIDKLIQYKKDKKTKLVGILNVTPDSFSDGGKYLEPDNAKKHLIQLIQDGADAIDIGAESTKPFSSAVSAEEQIERLKPVLKFIKDENIQIPVSIDTRSSVVADFALDYGNFYINDVSGFDYDSKIAEVIGKHKTGVIIQHSKGNPEDMQNNPVYENDVVEEIYFSLKNKIEYAKSIGIEKIIIDAGIGFGKTKENNFEILNRVEEFYSLDCPIMLGISRKSLLGTHSDNATKDALTLAVSYPLILKGVDYLRVHNVKLHKALIDSLTV